jgi:hypothetical protein
MGIRIDAYRASEVERLPMPSPIEIEAPRIGVDLDRHSVLCACLEDFSDLNLVAWASEQLPTGHVTQNRGAGIRNGAKDAVSLLLAAQLEPTVHARHDEVEGGQ